MQRCCNVIYLNQITVILSFISAIYSEHAESVLCTKLPVSLSSHYTGFCFFNDLYLTSRKSILDAKSNEFLISRWIVLYSYRGAAGCRRPSVELENVDYVSTLHCCKKLDFQIQVMRDQPCLRSELKKYKSLISYMESIKVIYAQKRDTSTIVYFILYYTGRVTTKIAIKHAKWLWKHIFVRLDIFIDSVPINQHLHCEYTSALVHKTAVLDHWQNYPMNMIQIQFTSPKQILYFVGEIIIFKLVATNVSLVVNHQPFSPSHSPASMSVFLAAMVLIFTMPDSAA